MSLINTPCKVFDDTRMTPGDIFHRVDVLPEVIEFAVGYFAIFNLEYEAVAC